MTTPHLTSLAQQIHTENRGKGFWDQPRALTETTMLIVTELAEAVEEDRAGRPGLWYHDAQNGEDREASDVWVDPGSGDAYRDDLSEEDDWDNLKPEGIDVELIDALIRLLDLLGSRGTDVDELIRIKRAYNSSRPAKHGKAY